MFNSFDTDSIKYRHLVGLIAAGEETEDIAAWLDCSEDYVTSVAAALTTAANDAIALADEAAQLARLNIVRLSRAVETGYSRDSLPAIKSTATADRYVLSVPAISVDVDETTIEIDATELDLSSEDSFDSAGDGYAVAAARAGKDLYLHVYVPGAGDPGLVVSDSATEPTGYTAGTDSRLIGGFHCTRLAQSSGSKATSGWTGLVVGDILPGSIWDISPNDIPTEV